MYFEPVADLHTHTLVSAHAYSTLTENASAAAQKGLLAIACTDHGPGIADGAHPWHFSCLNKLPDTIAGVRNLRGAEVNVCDFDGTLDLEEWRLKRLEIVIASMHEAVLSPSTVEQTTAAWLAVAKNPHVDIIGHCGLPQYAFDYETVIPVFGQYGKVVEINEGTFISRPAAIENCARIARLCKKHQVRVVVNSDAHYHTFVGDFPRMIALLEEVDFPKAWIVNSSRENLEAFLNEKGVAL